MPEEGCPVLLDRCWLRMGNLVAHQGKAKAAKVAEDLSELTVAERYARNSTQPLAEDLSTLRRG